MLVYHSILVPHTQYHFPQAKVREMSDHIVSWKLHTTYQYVLGTHQYVPVLYQHIHTQIKLFLTQACSSQDYCTFASHSDPTNPVKQGSVQYNQIRTKKNHKPGTYQYILVCVMYILVHPQNMLVQTGMYCLHTSQGHIAWGISDIQHIPGHIAWGIGPGLRLFDHCPV